MIVNVNNVNKDGKEGYTYVNRYKREFFGNNSDKFFFIYTYISHTSLK